MICFQTPEIEARETCSLSDDNMLLSGTVLKNTSEAVGVCVYRAVQWSVA